MSTTDNQGKFLIDSGSLSEFNSSPITTSLTSSVKVVQVKKEGYDTIEIPIEKGDGTPKEDLGIIISTTAPPDANYISTSYTQWTAQNTVGINNSGFFEFSFICMSTLTSSAELTSNLYHAGAGNTVHLSNAGYNFVSNKIIQQLINVDPIDTLRYGGDIQQNGYLSPFEENYHKTGLKLFKKLK